MEAFQNYLRKFMQVFLDEFCVYSDLVTHLDKLTLCLKKYQEYNISLNLEKRLFLMFSGLILGYLVLEDGKFPHPKKIEDVQQMKQFQTLHDIQTFNGLA